MLRKEVSRFFFNDPSKGSKNTNDWNIKRLKFIYTGINLSFFFFQLCDGHKGWPIHERNDSSDLDFEILKKNPKNFVKVTKIIFCTNCFIFFSFYDNFSNFFFQGNDIYFLLYVILKIFIFKYVLRLYAHECICTCIYLQFLDKGVLEGVSWWWWTTPAQAYDLALFTHFCQISAQFLNISTIFFIIFYNLD